MSDLVGNPEDRFSTGFLASRLNCVNVAELYLGHMGSLLDFVVSYKRDFLLLGLHYLWYFQCINIHIER